VNFTNLSENGDPDKYEWFFYYDLDKIKRDSENSDQPVDSIDFKAFEQNPVWTFENTGTYNVKLVSKHQSEFHVCVDTAYIEDFIVVDTSFVAAPNVFTPNGDGTNDFFNVIGNAEARVVGFRIFNRWGQQVYDNEYPDRGWDGSFKGKPQPTEVDYYQIEVQTPDGRWTRQGDVTLVR
jgi:gliding motility-associated-like protein